MAIKPQGHLIVWREMIAQLEAGNTVDLSDPVNRQAMLAIAQVVQDAISSAPVTLGGIDYYDQ